MREREREERVKKSYRVCVSTMVASTEANSVHAESMRELACAMQKQMKEEPEAPELTSDCRIGVKPQPSRKEAVVIKRETADSTLCPVTTTSSTRPFTTRDESLELRYVAKARRNDNRQRKKKKKEIPKPNFVRSICNFTPSSPSRVKHEMSQHAN